MSPRRQAGGGGRAPDPRGGWEALRDGDARDGGGRDARRQGREGPGGPDRAGRGVASVPGTRPGPAWYRRLRKVTGFPPASRCSLRGRRRDGERRPRALRFQTWVAGGPASWGEGTREVVEVDSCWGGKKIKSGGSRGAVARREAGCSRSLSCTECRDGLARSPRRSLGFPFCGLSAGLVSLCRAVKGKHTGQSSLGEGGF